MEVGFMDEQKEQLRIAIRALNELILSGVRSPYLIEADFMVNSFADLILPERQNDEPSSNRT